MAYSPIEESYMNGFVTTQFATPEPEPVLLAQNKNMSYPGEQFTDTGGGAAVGTRLKMPSGLNTPENIQKVGGEILPAGGAMLKGAGQASAGMYGDIEGLGRMVLNYMGVDVNKETKLPTTEDVKTFLDKYIPVDEKYATFEKAGELASPAGAYGLGKAGIKAIKSTKGMPIGNSIKMMDGTEITLPKAPKIESKAFKNWFGESKVSDDSGKPITVFHGTKDNIDRFMQGQPNKKDAGWLGDGFYFTDNPELASTYAEYLKSGPEGANVMPVYLSIKNPYEATMKDKEYLMMADRRGDKTALKEFTNNLIQQGYDGVILDYKKQMGVTEPVKEYVAFKPEQIKSVFNKGQFNPKDSRLLYGGASVTVSGEPENKENK